MKVEQEIVVWTAAVTEPLFEAAAERVAAVLEVRRVASEEEFTASLPPLRNPCLFMVGVDALTGATAGLRALLAGRPGSWPPMVLFGPDPAALKAVDAAPNSRLVVTRENAAEVLSLAARYWGTVNLPLELE